MVSVFLQLRLKARAAARAGAAVLNHTKITGLDLGRGGIVAAHAGDMRISCRSVINAAGAWVDTIRLMRGRARETDGSAQQGSAYRPRAPSGLAPAGRRHDAPGGWAG